MGISTVEGKQRDTLVNMHVECESHSHFRNVKIHENVQTVIKLIIPFLK